MLGKQRRLLIARAVSALCQQNAGPVPRSGLPSSQDLSQLGPHPAQSSRIMALHSQADIESVRAMLTTGLSMSQIGAQLGMTPVKRPTVAQSIA